MTPFFRGRRLLQVSKLKIRKILVKSGNFGKKSKF